MKLVMGCKVCSWTTSKEHFTRIKQAIKYAITWPHKAWVKLMQLGTSAISGTWSNLAVINHKDVSKPEVKLRKCKYY